MFPPHSQAPTQSMPLDVHAHQHQHQHQHQLPALSQPGYAAHGVPGSHPAMVLPPPSVYNDHQYAQHASQEQVQTPTTPAQETAKPMPTVDQLNATAKALEPICGKQGPWTFRLDVVQQPKRARMCGFGDKDRRPITPPPCIRLVITDSQTGKEVDCNEIEHTMYILNVDLWSEDALREVNLVRHTTTTPSISSTTPASFESMEAATPAPSYPNILPSSSREGAYGAPHPVFAHPNVNPYAQPQYGQVTPYMSSGGYAPANQFYPGAEFRPDLHPGMPQLPSQGGGMPFAQARMYASGDPLMSQRMGIPGASNPTGMFTRNLIGSLSASAFRLTDPQDKIGIWFILQDLSVRTEGNFRLRFSFVNVADPIKGKATASSLSSANVNPGSCPVLASCFSDSFTVYSAKKFPGVCESTPLSKCFATQGIKIPIRKEGAGNTKGGDDDDYE